MLEPNEASGPNEPNEKHHKVAECQQNAENQGRRNSGPAVANRNNLLRSGLGLRVDPEGVEVWVEETRHGEKEQTVGAARRGGQHELRVADHLNLVEEEAQEKSKDGQGSENP